MWLRPLQYNLHRFDHFQVSATRAFKIDVCPTLPIGFLKTAEVIETREGVCSCQSLPVNWTVVHSHQSEIPKQRDLCELLQTYL